MAVVRFSTNGRPYGHGGTLFNTVLKLAVSYIVHAFATRNWGRPLTRTKLMKLLYLADLEAFKATSRTVTGAAWKSYYYGPFAQEILRAVDDLDGSALAQRIAVQPSGQPYYRYEPLGDAPDLPPAVRGIVDGVVERYGALPLPALLEHVYATGPYRAAQKLGDPLDFRAG